MRLLITILLALVPVLIWGFIFYKKDPVFRPKAKQTFLLGMMAVTPILLYKWSWNFLPQINVFNYTNQFQTDVFSFTPHLYLPFGSLLAFAFVGVIEEYMKHLVVKKADRGFFRNIDDAIEYSVIAALGFSFVENVLYFYYIWTYQGTEIFIVSFVFRSIFSTFAHVLFSGIFGYFYGLAYFAEPLWSEQERKNRHSFWNAFFRILHLDGERVFATEKITQGLFLAVFLHGAFNILLEMNATFFMIPFLVFGYSYLSYLFNKKENLKAYGYLVGEKSTAHVHQLLWEAAVQKKAVVKGEIAHLLRRT